VNKPKKIPPLWEHQKTAVNLALKKFLNDYSGFAYFMQMGTGKTICAIFLILNSWRKGERLPNLIIAPKSALSVWEHQLNIHVAIPYNLILAKKGFCIPKTERPLFVLVNFEQSWRIPELVTEWNYVIVDESHRIKSPTSKQSKAIADLGTRANYRLILSGTPVGNTPLDLWAQFRFLKPEVFGNNWWKFKNHYCYKTGYMGYKTE